MLKFLFVTLWVVAWGLATPAFANSPKKGAKTPVPDSQKEINFDGDVVEGLNRRPLDSLTATSEEGRRLGVGHTYRRVKNFDEESQELSRDLAETY